MLSKKALPDDVATGKAVFKELLELFLYRPCSSGMDSYLEDQHPQEAKRQQAFKNKNALSKCPISSHVSSLCSGHFILLLVGPYYSSYRKCVKAWTLTGNHMERFQREK